MSDQIKLNQLEMNGVINQIDQKIDQLEIEPDYLNQIGDITANESALTEFKEQLIAMQNVLRNYKLLLLMDLSLVKKSMKEIKNIDSGLASDFSKLNQ